MNVFKRIKFWFGRKKNNNFPTIEEINWILSKKILNEMGTNILSAYAKGCSISEIAENLECSENKVTMCIVENAKNVRKLRKL